MGDLFRVNVYTEKLAKVLNNPGKVRRWLTDRAGVVRLGISQDETTEIQQIIYRSNEKSEWVTIETFAADGDEWMPLGFEGDNRTLYIRSNAGRSTAAIYTYDPEQRKITGTVFAHDTYDAGGIIYSRHLKKVIGVSYEAEKQRIEWLDPERLGRGR